MGPFGIGSTCRVTDLLGSGSKTCRVRVAVGGSNTSGVVFTLLGRGSRGIGVCCSVVHGRFIVSHDRDKGISFDISFPTIAITPIFRASSVALHLFISHSDVRTFNRGNGFIVAGRIFPSRPCGEVSFISSHNGFAIGSVAICQVGWR